VGPANADELCKKEDGECTGESTLPWQIDEGVYTNECPKVLLERWGKHISLWQTWDLHGLPESGGWMDQRALFLNIHSLLENESRRMRRLNGQR